MNDVKYPPRYVDRAYVRYRDVEGQNRKSVEIRHEEEGYRCVLTAPGGILRSSNPKHCSYVTTVAQFHDAERVRWDDDGDGQCTSRDAFFVNDAAVPSSQLTVRCSEFEAVGKRADAVLDAVATRTASVIGKGPACGVFSGVQHVFRTTGGHTYSGNTKRTHFNLRIPTWGMLRYDPNAYRFRDQHSLITPDEKMTILVDFDSLAEARWLRAVTIYLNECATTRHERK